MVIIAMTSVTCHGSRILFMTRDHSLERMYLRRSVLFSLHYGAAIWRIVGSTMKMHYTGKQIGAN